MLTVVKNIASKYMYCKVVYSACLIKIVKIKKKFHHLLCSGKLPSPQDVQHWLAYTVKIMELSAKFSWPSVLQYDDEFRHIQAVYNYPWSFDSHHFHTVTLEPLVLAPKPSLGKTSQVSSVFANYSSDGRVICRNFNRLKGCTLYECHFAHQCNRKVNGKACRQSHPSHSHPGVVGGSPGTGDFSYIQPTPYGLSPQHKSLAGRTYWR